MEPTDKQINYIVYQVKANRGMSDLLQEAFPDRLEDEANYWVSDLEHKLKYLSRDTASEVIGLLMDEDEAGFEYLIDQLNQINQ